MDTNTILLEAGLIDTKGAPTSAPNFGAASEPDRDVLDWGDTGLEDTRDSSVIAEPATPATQVETPAAQPQAQPFQDQPRQTQTYTPEQARAIGQQQLVGQVNEAIMAGLEMRDAEGKAVYTRAQLEQMFTPQLQADMRHLEVDVLQHQMAPYAKRMAADHIAKEHGIKADDLLSEPSVDAMQAAARTIARLQRDQKFEARKDSRADTVEGGRSISNTIPESFAKLSPAQKIKYGLMRGDI
jgi:hypothetical protein